MLLEGEQQLSGWLRVAASVGCGRLKLLPLVKTFLAAHPDVKGDLRLNDGFIDLVEEGIDLAVRVGELADSSLLARRIATTRRALIASPTYLHPLPKGLKAPRVPEDSLQHNCIVHSELATQNAWSFTAGPGAPVAGGGQEIGQGAGSRTARGRWLNEASAEVWQGAHVRMRPGGRRAERAGRTFLTINA